MDPRLRRGDTADPVFSTLGLRVQIGSPEQNTRLAVKYVDIATNQAVSACSIRERVLRFSQALFLQAPNHPRASTYVFHGVAVLRCLTPEDRPTYPIGDLKIPFGDACLDISGPDCHTPSCVAMTLYSAGRLSSHRLWAASAQIGPDAVPGILGIAAAPQERIAFVDNDLFNMRQDWPSLYLRAESMPTDQQPGDGNLIRLFGVGLLHHGKHPRIQSITLGFHPIYCYLILVETLNCSLFDSFTVRPPLARGIDAACIDRS